MLADLFQIELGISGGLAGVARTGGGAIATTVFQTVLVNVQSRFALNHVVPAAEAAGATPTIAKVDNSAHRSVSIHANVSIKLQAVAAALPLGAEAVEKVQGITAAIADAAGAAFVESYVHGLRSV